MVEDLAGIVHGHRAHVGGELPVARGGVLHGAEQFLDRLAGPQGAGHGYLPGQLVELVEGVEKLRLAVHPGQGLGQAVEGRAELDRVVEGMLRLGTGTPQGNGVHVDHVGRGCPRSRRCRHRR